MKKRIFSTFMALVMVLGVLVAPFNIASAATEETETLTIHKILMSQAGLDAHDVEKEGYDGNEITNIKDFFESDAKEIAGVYFKLQKPADGVTNPDVNNGTQWVDMGEDYEGLTTENGLELNTKGLSGQYRIVEVHEKSTYIGENGNTLTDRKAVPSVVTLPLVNDEGVVTNAHMYPKNTEDKPQIDKNFIKENGLEAAEGFDNQDLLNAGAAYENYQAKKATAEAEIGKNVPYEVKTEIPANSNLAEAKWDDKMTEGLTYNKDLEVTIQAPVPGSVEETTLTHDQLIANGILEETDKGFVFNLTGEYLNYINGKTDKVTVTLKYSATVNENAIADIPEANDITFHYGNTPSKGTTPVPASPSNGELTVNKTWADGTWADGESATFKLVDANTGEDVTADDLVNAPADYTFEGTVTIGYDEVNGGSYTWKYLDDNKQYKAVEIESTTMSDAEYTIDENGNIAVTNHKSTNPKPLNPTEPKVVLGGKRFVKTNNDGSEKLAGAVFYVKNEAGQYLVADHKDGTAVTEAKAALDKAVEDYNKLSAEQQAGQEGTDAKEAIDSAQDAYNKAFKANANNYKWEDDNTNAVELTSNSEGQFEIKGLAYGTYFLEEKSAPSGYAKLTEDVKFTVAKDSYIDKTKDDGEIEYESVFINENKMEFRYGQQVKNKKVSIPQTGGIGSLIFIVAGVTIMGVALVAYKRNQQEA